MARIAFQYILSIFTLLLSLHSLAFTEKEKEEIGKLGAEYIANNPQYLLRAQNKLQEQDLAAHEKKIIDLIVNKTKTKSKPSIAQQLINDNRSPTYGKKEASVAIIEFFDYQCHYCKLAHPAVQKVMDTEQDIQVIFKEHPIFGGELSEYASKIGMLAYKTQGIKTYLDYQNQLYSIQKKSKTQLSINDINQAAKNAQVKLDIKQMSQPAEGIDTSLLKTHTELGKSLGIRGTPCFIVMPTKDANPHNITLFMGYPGADKSAKSAVLALKRAIKTAKTK